MIEEEHTESFLALLELMSTGCRKQPEEHLADVTEEKIRARRQTSLWLEFCDKINAYGSPTTRITKLQAYEVVVSRLLEQILRHLTLSSSELFLDWNSVSAEDDQFNEYFDNKRDLGKVLR